ncbi:MAG: phosphatase PAP2 family protein [Candidatus Marinimicrobia bacterium]|nr:phosphatase PAP2 family protein [Candidatus Neomarinimicrobiota bacterium]
MKAAVSRIDLKIFQAIFNFRRNTVLPLIFRIISFIGDGYFYGLYLVYLYFSKHDIFRPALFVILLAFATELPLYRVLKNTIRRVRPFNAHDEIENMVYPLDEFSFPSGHTSAAFLVAMIIAHFTPFLAIPMFAFALLVGMSRIYLGVHYPSDIIGGAIYGTGMAQIAILIVEKIILN